MIQERRILCGEGTLARKEIDTFTRNKSSNDGGTRKKEEESRETQRERKIYIYMCKCMYIIDIYASIKKNPPRNRKFFSHVALGTHALFPLRFLECVSFLAIFSHLPLPYAVRFSRHGSKVVTHPRVNHPLARSWSSVSLNRHILVHRYVSFQIFSRIGYVRGESSARRFAVRNYTTTLSNDHLVGGAYGRTVNQSRFVLG